MNNLVIEAFKSGLYSMVKKAQSDQRGDNQQTTGQSAINTNKKEDRSIFTDPKIDLADAVGDALSSYDKKKVKR